MDKLDQIPAQSVDLVWSGQSIEHITTQQALEMLSHIKRILTPQGSFCFDTPNRRLTNLLCRMGFIHPEHKVEYVPAQIRDLLQASGFTVVQSLAVSPMPMSLKWQKFCKLELQKAPSIGADADEGFSFFMQCKLKDLH
jgi:SAM-dependent methyltransferase